MNFAFDLVTFYCDAKYHDLEKIVYCGNIISEAENVCIIVGLTEADMAFKVLSHKLKDHIRSIATRQKTEKELSGNSQRGRDRKRQDRANWEWHGCLKLMCSPPGTHLLQ